MRHVEKQKVGKNAKGRHEAIMKFAIKQLRRSPLNDQEGRD
jgi:hypothetical protein